MKRTSQFDHIYANIHNIMQVCVLIHGFLPDINECEIYGKCSQRCVNNVGSYKCECIRGYDVHDVGSSRKSCKAVGMCVYNGV